jgi:hypothetical protein
LTLSFARELRLEEITQGDSTRGVKLAEKEIGVRRQNKKRNKQGNDILESGCITVRVLKK